MATLIPAIGSCSSRMTPGERRFASRLEEKLESDYLCWYDVSIGERTKHPDFVVFHPGLVKAIWHRQPKMSTLFLRVKERIKQNFRAKF
jgi:hypothetical protein